MLILKKKVNFVDKYQIIKIIFEIFIDDDAVNTNRFSLPSDYVIFLMSSVGEL